MIVHIVYVYAVFVFDVMMHIIAIKMMERLNKHWCVCLCLNVCIINICTRESIGEHLYIVHIHKPFT